MAEREGAVFPKVDGDGFMHNPESGFSLFLQERCKRIYFIRHAEGFHNVGERESTMEPKVNILLKENGGEKFWDSALTPLGEQQCARLKEQIRGDSVWSYEQPLDLDLVVVSPLTRTLQTAVLSLGEPGTPGAPPFLANELCRERVADYMCDGRRNKSELMKEFPGVDFSLVENEEDVQFVNQKEDESLCEKRALKFLQWLCGRPEIHIAVVCHSIFLKCLFRQFGSSLSQEDQAAIHSFPANAEMRSIMLCAHKKFASTKSDKEQDERPARKVLWDGRT